MADNFKQNNENLPEDSELFASEVSEELSEKDVFSGDDEFFQEISEYINSRKKSKKSSKKQKNQSFKTTNSGSKKPEDTQKLSFENFVTEDNLNPSRKIFTLQNVLAAGIVFFAALMTFFVFNNNQTNVTANNAKQNYPPEPVSSFNNAQNEKTLPQKAKIASAEKETAIKQEKIEKEPVEKKVAVGSKVQKESETGNKSFSLYLAEELFNSKKFKDAQYVYTKLLANFPPDLSKGTIKDYLNFRIAQCAEAQGKADEAYEKYRSLLNSESPVIKTAVNYRLSIYQMQRRNYNKARTRAYSAKALYRALNLKKEMQQEFRENCDFLITSSLTKQILALNDADQDMPVKFWINPGEFRIFKSVTSDNISKKIETGIDKVRHAFLGPKIEKLNTIGDIDYYKTVSNQASIEEILARLSAKTNKELIWQFGKNDERPQSKRTVSVFMPKADEKDIADVSAGAAGLMAILENDQRIKVYNPLNYESLTEHLKILTKKAISSLHRFMVSYPESEKIAKINFALGLLYDQNGKDMEAVARYHMIAKKYHRNDLAPYALLNSSKIKAKIKDHKGAEEDLRILVEQYPDIDIAGRATLNLAEESKNAGMHNEAARLFKKVYFLESSKEMQKRSSYGAGVSFYELQKYDKACNWLGKYLKIAEDNTEQDFYNANFIMGKCFMELGKPAKACRVFEKAMNGNLAKDEYFKTLVELVNSNIQRNDFLKAWDTLQSVNNTGFSIQKTVGLVCLKARVLRKMGLNEKAVFMIKEKEDYVNNYSLKGYLLYQKALCLFESAMVEEGEKILDELFNRLERSDLRYDTGIKLAELNLEKENSEKTETICKNILDGHLAEDQKIKALKLLARSYKKQKMFDKAAVTILKIDSSKEFKENLVATNTEKNL